jgi:hypothetical protein
VDATYTLAITNTGNVVDTIELTIPVNETDAAILSEDTLILNASESATVSLNVSSAEVGIYNTTVRATSQGNPSVYDDATVTTTVMGPPGVSITAKPKAQTTAPNETANYTLTITNTGTVADTIELTIPVNEADAAILSGDTLILNASESETVSLNVKDPDAGIYNTTVRATSQGNPSVYDDVTVTTTVTDGEPTAVKIPDANGSQGSYVEVPVNIANVMNGPIQGIRLEVDYNESVLNMTSISGGDISSGNLTSTWTDMKLGDDGHTMILATDNTGDAIPNGSSGTVVWMNFSVLGSLGDTSPMDLSLIELSNPEGQTGTAPAKNGIFTVVLVDVGSVEGTITYACNGTEMAGVDMSLDADTTVTNETGDYNFTDVSPGDYVVSATKPRFWDNYSTNVTVIAGEVTTEDMTLYLKGDLNDDCGSADPGDVILMLQASARDIPGNERYDLNENGVIADAGDVVLILRASVGDIILW